MQRWKNIFWISAAILALTALAGSIAPPAIARVRAALVRDVDQPTRQPFAAGISEHFGSSNTMIANLLTVPSGKRAVIEHLSCHAFLVPSNNWVRFEMTFNTNVIGARHHFVPTHLGESLVAGLDVWSFSQPVRAYAEPGTPISIHAQRRLTASSFEGVSCVISGHYVDLTP